MSKTYKKLMELLIKKNLLDKTDTEPHIIQLVGDRDKPSISKKDIAFTIPANPMSDRGQFVLEYINNKGEVKLSKTFLQKAITEIIKKNNGTIPNAWDLYNKNPINSGIAKTLSCDCGHLGTAGCTAITDTNIKGDGNLYKNVMKKLKFNMEDVKVFDSFAGVGALLQSLKELGVPTKLIGISEVDVDCIIDYAGIHIDNFKDMNFEYPSEDIMKKYLMDRNIGYDFKKNKSTIPRTKKEKLKLCYKASVLTNNLGDVSKLNYDEIEDFDLFNLSFCCQDISGGRKTKGIKERRWHTYKKWFG